MEKDTIKSLQEQTMRKIQEEKLKMACTNLPKFVNSLPVLTREEMVPSKHMQNLAELPVQTIPSMQLWAAQASCQTGRWQDLPGWRQFGAAKTTVKKRL